MDKEVLAKRILKVKNSKVVRLIAYPVVNISRKITLNKFKNSADSEYIRSLKNAFKGQRCFIIGNGPSLTPSDLDKIKNEVSFAANRIYYMFDKTEWRPTFYMCCDKEAIMMNFSSIVDLPVKTKFIEVTSKKYNKTNDQSIKYVYHYDKFYLNKWKTSAPFVSEDPSAMMFPGQTVTFSAMQLAIYMGFSKIYLLGVDHNYATKVDKNGKVTVDPTVQTYFAGMKDANLSVQFVDVTTDAYRAAKKYCDSHDSVKIYNATRGGKLEIFERVNFDDLFDREECPANG